MKNIVIAAVLALLFSCPVLAQQTLLGKYSGSFVLITKRGDVNAGLTLEILTVEGDTVKGKAVRMAEGTRVSCAGEYPVEGKVKGDALELIATEKGGPAGDCPMTFRLTVEGSKLVGTMNNFKTQLSK